MRGRFSPCRGCPTVECTCMTDLEEELLVKLNDVLDKYKDSKTTIECMLKDMKRFRDALEFYAEKAHQQSGIFAWGAHWDRDLGRIAREALK